jgi:hypothetical protein
MLVLDVTDRSHPGGRSTPLVYVWYYVCAYVSGSESCYRSSGVV